MMKIMRLVIMPIIFIAGFTACAGPDHRAAVGDPGKRVQTLLDESIDRGLNRLGQPGGVGKDEAVHINLPEELARAERILRRIRLERLLDDLHSSLNRTAEAVMAPAKTIIRQAVPHCFKPDPALLRGGPDAITRRLRAQCDTVFLTRLKPVVTEAMHSHQAAAPYRRFTRKLTALDRADEVPRLDLESWLARGVLDGIYVAVADEERRARQRAGL